VKEHVCGWGEVEDVWCCVQDYYAEGYRPDTACGARMDPVCPDCGASFPTNTDLERHAGADLKRPAPHVGRLSAHELWQDGPGGAA